MSWLRGALLGICAAVCWTAAAQSGVGIAPVYDGGGAPYGQTFAQYLTLYTFNDLNSAKGFAPTLLNPGAVYTPLDTSWLVDYTQDSPGVDVLLVTTLKPTVSPEHGKWKLSVEATLANKKTGASDDSWVVETEIKGKDTDISLGLKEKNPLRTMFGSDYRTFDKSPLGKAAQRLADELVEGLTTRLHAGAGAAAKTAAGGAPCMMKVRITYGYRHAASQAYSLLVNGLEEGIETDGGVATFQAPAGLMLVQFSVADPPYKMAAQPLYQFSTVHSCENKMYVVDVGRSGEAHDRWE